MSNRVITDVLIGLGLAVAGQLVQMGASELGPVLGLPHPYDMAPADGSIPPGLLNQISSAFALAAVGMLILSLVIGWLLQVRDVRVGVQRGLVWAAVVAVSQMLLGLGEGVVPVFGLLGTWVYFAAIVAGPVLAGLLGARLPARERVNR